MVTEASTALRQERSYPILTESTEQPHGRNQRDRSGHGHGHGHGTATATTTATTSFNYRDTVENLRGPRRFRILVVQRSEVRKGSDRTEPTYSLSDPALWPLCSLS